MSLSSGNTFAEELAAFENRVTDRLEDNLEPGPFRVILEDRKSSGTAGGAFNNGAWRTRDLTDEVADNGNVCTLAANQFTLLSGTYYIRAVAPAYRVDLHQCRLYNITDGGVQQDQNGNDVLGGNAVSDSTTGTQTDSILISRFVIAAQKTFELQHRCSTTRAGNGQGRPVSWGNEIYSRVELVKVS